MVLVCLLYSGIFSYPGYSLWRAVDQYEENFRINHVIERTGLVKLFTWLYLY